MKEVLTALAFVLACGGLSALAAQDASPPASFQRKAGPWTIAGDPKSFGCVAFGLADGATKLTAATLPSRSDYVFALGNPAWKSIAHDAEMRITADFFDTKNQRVDSWNLSTTGVNSETGGPAFNFYIERAANDGASFRQNFAEHDRIVFSKDRVPIAEFKLTGSREAMNLLDECRSALRKDKNFDPFAR